MRKTLLSILAAVMALSMFTGCSGQEAVKAEAASQVAKTVKAPYSDFTYEVDPATFDIVIDRDGVKEHASVPMKRRNFTELKKEADRMEWTYPEEQVKVIIEKKEDYLNIRIQSIGAEQFAWPTVQADSYMLPLWEGKRIPSSDPNWKQFLQDETFTWSESFSMNFMAMNMKHYALLYIVENPFNNEVSFDTESNIGMTFSHEFPSINPKKEYGFRLYVTNNDPVAIAKLYRGYVQEKQGFKTLAEKAQDNPEIKKLYGAPHIYMWNNQLLTDSNIRWQAMKKKLNDPIWTWIAELADRYTEDGAQELNSVLQEVKKESLNAYHKRVIVKALNQVIKLEQLYRPDRFQSADAALLKTIADGVDKLSEQKLYAFNKNLLKSAFQEAVDDPSEWGRDHSTELVEDMHQAGIAKAWIGLPNWADGLMNPAFVEKAAKLGYLIGPYDSYHSIQKQENKDWNTAYFSDNSLYEQATITNEKGKKIGGFLNRGRKLNPALSLPSVKQRVDSILQDGIMYNSWFIDCDATGEIYDDYSPGHVTTQEQDMDARLERMDYIAKEKHMVIGSEGGNDFASRVIAFAHGLETPVIKWSDKDMREDKNSPYYVGAYWSAQGGIPERYAKQVPIKELYQHVYVDPAYTLPLFKLVYNDSVITTHHWEWGSLKIKDEAAERMLYELLYNVPPLYHLDKEEWESHKKMITDYLAVWSPFHAKAVTKEMTAFQVLSPDRLVQSAEYGSDLKVVANFSDKDAVYGNDTVKAKSAVIYEGDKQTVFNAASAVRQR
ncbi:glycoside hydrolase [Paenibacillus sp. OSY-SE]|uniref:glycoside hydrolase n=1 Tax=Paenibacillus sp. OSY-SE TaxID=1196323 RepID=UPI00030766F1|nr:glycoside hydrolase [Paenibacillus sp. OSY-SE]